MSTAPKSVHFKRLQDLQVEYVPTTITQYESTRTGMRIIVIGQKGPRVYGHFTLATEIHDDSGSPHTLEHLCFTGSRKYQYTGFLDKLATRLYSETNAWTATDHTAYTLETAGWEGFAQILPVYLDHVLAPTLTDTACFTEVYHVDGTGHDAGVVYSEMQGVQNNSSELMDLAAKRIMYPPGVGYRYETGGMMDQLRVLTAERIRAFHKEMYQPRNLCLIISGEVDHQTLLDILSCFEDTILDIIPNPSAPFKRPWIDSSHIFPLSQSTVETIEFPEEDESVGEVEIRLLGPDHNDAVQQTALGTALSYLAGSSAAILQNKLVEKEQLATLVDFYTEPRPNVEIRFSLTSVATKKLAYVERRFFEVLNEAMKREVDIDYMWDSLQRQKRTWKLSTENSTAAFEDYAIADFLFGNRDGSTLADVTTLHDFDVLESWGEKDWRNFIKKWISDAPHVSILGVPSSKLASKLKKEEKARVKERRGKLGKQGLENLAKRLEEAKADQERAIPRDDLLRFKIPSIDSIHFFETITLRSGKALDFGRSSSELQKRIDADSDPNSPLFIHFEHIQSNFVQIVLNISTQGLPTELLPLLSVYTEGFFNLPISRNGKTISFEDVVIELERDTVYYHISNGFISSPHQLRISLQAEREKYPTLISWLKELAWNSIFDIERLRSITTRLLSDVPEAKREGDDMLFCVRDMIQQTSDSVPRAKNTLVKALYLKRIQKLLEKDPTIVVRHMEHIRNHLFRFENFRVLVVSDMNKLENPVSSWKPFIHGLDHKAALRPIVKLRERLTKTANQPGHSSYIVPIPAIDSSFAMMMAKGLDSYYHPKLPAMMATIAYMNAVEGPLWVAVRGTGLAYGASIRYSIEAEEVSLRIYRSPNAYKAFEASRKVVEDLISGKIHIDPTVALEGAVSTIVSDFVADQATMSSAAESSFIDQVMREQPPDYMKNIIKKAQEITVEDIKLILKELILPIFTGGKSNVLVTCATVMAKDVQEGFRKNGFEPKIQLLKDFQDDYGLKPADSEGDIENGTNDDDDDDNDDDDDDDDDDDAGSDGDSDESGASDE